MPEDNFNLINPVEALHNISQLNTISDRKQHKRKDKWDQKHEPQEEQLKDELPKEKDLKNSAGKKLSNHSIDFRA